MCSVHRRADSFEQKKGHKLKDTAGEQLFSKKTKEKKAKMDISPDEEVARTAQSTPASVR